ncbi:MAG: hypothetical protein WC229_02880 [Candidatus Paceibacterota bacterium]|jgi:hypothetical protein
MFYPNEEEKRNKLEDIKKGLYSRENKTFSQKKRHLLSSRVVEANTDWSGEDLKKESDFKVPYKKIFLIAIAFFVFAIGFASYKFFISGNMISGDNVDILIRGPVSIAGGEELPLDVEVKNKNNVDLKVVDLKIQYPDGTRNTSDLSVPLIRYSELLGDINTGKSVKRLLKSVLFGEENVKKDIKFTVEYRVPGSNAIFYKEKIYSVLINSSPINLKVLGVGEISANQQTEFVLEIESNSLSMIKNLILKVDYPFGFDYISASPKPFSVDNSVWNIGDLEPGAKRTIKISGSVNGQDGEERVFRFTVGTPDKLDEKTINTAFSVYTANVLIKKPFLGVNLFINGDSAKEVVVTSGSKINAGVVWQNNLVSNIYDVAIKVKLSGPVLNKSSIRVENGFYNSVDNTITFDKQKDKTFASVSPGYEGENGFTFSIFGPESQVGSSINNPEILMDISVMGNRVQGGGVSQDLLYSSSKKIKVASVLKLYSRGFRTIGPFENSGPMPPKAEQESTYTITWSATNLLNDVNNAKVSAILPSYIKWNNLTSPSIEKIEFNPSNSEVTWNIGGIKAGTGSIYYPRDVSFSISFTPSLSQVGTSPEIVGQATITGTDSFTGVEVGEVRTFVNTQLTSDPAYSNGYGTVGN